MYYIIKTLQMNRMRNPFNHNSETKKPNKELRSNMV